MNTALLQETKGITVKGGVPVNADITAAIVVGALSIGYFGMALAIPIGGLDTPGPGLIPRVLGALMLLFSFMYLLRSAQRAARNVEGTVRQEVRWRTLKPVLLIIVGLFAFGLLLNVVGFLIAVFLLMFLSLRVVGHRNSVSAVAAILVALVSHLVFGVWLKIPFPEVLF
ncbi:MAG: tripartite tricarboxylate transporter TctB family protein [Firmicutes bacterium]|nr:tripartite tricarboxylate transporter TctB family protein [Bacillota bacterium]